MNSLEFLVRPAVQSDLMDMQKIFVGTITTICTADYDDEQIKAWVSGVENTQRWNEIISKQLVLVAHVGNNIIGFITLHNGNYIDLLYVHKDYQRQGIAKRLLDDIIKEASLLQQKEITSDVSKTAKPFFESNGFKQLKLQSNVRQGVIIENYKMMKNL
jgi:putative acetyltransferase